VANNATELYREMASAVYKYSSKRKSDDTSSPNRNNTIEAMPGCSFNLTNYQRNVPLCRSIDLRWATANVLHFFANTEEAAPLLVYNKNASRFLVDGKWKGAYGAIAVPQLHKCIWLLRNQPYTRRAIVSMGDLSTMDYNRPACWSFIHFLQNNGNLDMLVYQRSLSLAVMPYDLVMLTNILRFVAVGAGIPAGVLRWTVGSLHATVGDTPTDGHSDTSVLLPVHILQDQNSCYAILENPTKYDVPHMAAEGEVRS
jgi:thymidylate synthase